MALKYKIALIQLYPKPLAPAHNFAKAESQIRIAASAGARLAILPEYAFTSWQPSSPSWECACAEAAQLLPSLRQLAASLGIALVPGTLVEKLPDGSLANVCYFISSTGDLVGRYVKRNLWHPERGVVQPGREAHDVFDTELGPVGILVCWDLAFPEAMRELVAGGAKLIVVPTWWLLGDAGDGVALNPDSEKLFLESMIVCRAFENTCAVAFVNAGGPSTPEDRASDTEANAGEHREYAGLSQLGLPILGAKGKLGAEEGMSIVEVDMGVLDVAEKTYKVREDLGKEDWHYHVSSKLP
ncbi:hypothetical protein jhhlp_000226 [Lomentospora prolificans]|uniref:CN hydrolase domain-containing protein n=1 Tax=Lomentospora prolificans TaxID=41688 RepID=A0A2N3NKA3_9PEZI|nr:hypothetical protein jhhlp_000226 [Lomentospora prolificans]